MLLVRFNFFVVGLETLSFFTNDRSMVGYGRGGLACLWFFEPVYGASCHR